MVLLNKLGKKIAAKILRENPFLIAKIVKYYTKNGLIILLDFWSCILNCS
jgi:hypothetical protein